MKRIQKEMEEKMEKDKMRESSMASQEIDNEDGEQNISKLKNEIAKLKVIENKYKGLETEYEKYKKENDSLKKEIEFNKLKANTRNENAKPKELIAEIAKSENFKIYGKPKHLDGQGEEEDYEEIDFGSGNIPPQFLQNQHMGEEGVYDGGDGERYGEEGEEGDEQELDEEQLKYFQMMQNQNQDKMNNNQMDNQMNNNQINNQMNNQMKNQSPFDENDLEEFEYQNEEMDGEEGEVYNIENGEGEVNFDQFVNDDNAEYVEYGDNEEQGEDDNVNINNMENMNNQNGPNDGNNNMNGNNGPNNTAPQNNNNKDKKDDDNNPLDMLNDEINEMGFDN